MALSETEFSDLVRTYTRHLRGVARSFVDDEELARDLVQDVWASVWRKRDEVQIRRDIGSWLHGATLNRCRAFHRRRNRRTELRSRSSPSERGDDSSRQAPLEARLLMARVWREIAELPDLQRRVLLARLIDGLSTAETADLVNRAEGTVRASLSSARKRLRDRLGSTLAQALSDVSALDSSSG